MYNGICEQKALLTLIKLNEFKLKCKQHELFTAYHHFFLYAIIQWHLFHNSPNRGMCVNAASQFRTLHDGNLGHDANGKSDSNWVRRVDSAL